MIRPRSIIVIVIIAIFIWAIFAPPSALQNFRMSLANIAKLPLKITSRSLNYIRKISRLPYADSEKTELRARISTLENKLTNLEEASLENKRLRDLLGFKQKGEKYSIPALIIGRDPNNWSSIILIDKGRQHGITKDMIVISGQGLVGRIREFGKTMSKVMLINDVDSKVGALVQRTRDQGLLIGTPQGNCRLIYLPVDSDVKEGDKILTSGMGGIYPKGILIGEVRKVTKEKGRLYKYAVVKTSTKLSKLEEVLCIR